MTKNVLARLSAEQLRRAASIRDKIQSLERELDRLVGQPSSNAPGQRGYISPEGRARIAEAQRARWARVKGKTAPRKKA